MSDLQRFVEDTKLKHRGTVSPLPQFEPYKNFEYDPTDLRDPFAGKIDLAPDNQDNALASNSSGLSPNQTRRKEPLEFFPLDTLKMVGILEQNTVTWGLVKAPDGTIHRILEGNYAGENYGQITRITEDRVNILEIVPDGLGAWVEREASLALGEE